LARFFLIRSIFPSRKVSFFWCGEIQGYRIRFLKWKIKYARAVLAKKGFLLEAG